jgi:hypothetical protein
MNKIIKFLILIVFIINTINISQANFNYNEIAKDYYVKNNKKNKTKNNVNNNCIYNNSTKYKYIYKCRTSTGKWRYYYE